MSLKVTESRFSRLNPLLYLHSRISTERTEGTLREEEGIGKQRDINIHICIHILLL